MSMTEQNNPAPAADPKPAKPKRKYRRRQAPTRRDAPPAKAATPDYLAGMTGAQCAAGCNEKTCVISGKLYCAHPHKGGLQTGEKTNSDALQRYNAARLLLGTALLEKRFGSK